MGTMNTDVKTTFEDYVAALREVTQDDLHEKVLLVATIAAFKRELAAAQTYIEKLTEQTMEKKSDTITRE